MAIPGLRVLVSGHVNGNMSKLLDKVESLSKKSVFDLLIISGDVFPAIPSNLDSMEEENLMENWMDDLLGNKYKNLPSSLYILGPRTEYQKQCYSKMIRKSSEMEEVNTRDLLLQGCDVLDGKITILGRSGIMTTMDGLNIAYFSGDEADGFKDSDVESLHLTAVSTSKIIDILVTPFWPHGISNESGITVPDAISFRSTNGSILASKLVNCLQPRYVVSASTVSKDCPMGLFYERQPFRNHVVLKEGQRPVSRFLSLGMVSDKKEPKWLYAFQMKPAQRLLSHDKETGGKDGRMELIRQPEDTTESPFIGINLSFKSSKSGSKRESEDVQFFYQMPDQMPKRGRREGDRMMSRPNEDRYNDQDRDQIHQKDQVQQNQYQRQDNSRPRQDYSCSSCWFCLASPDVDKKLIISIGNQCYLACAKGGLVEEHILITPIEHIRCYMDLFKEGEEKEMESNRETVLEMKRFQDSLVKYFESKDCFAVFFERNYKSQHMQVQAVPIPKQVLGFHEDVEQDQEGREDGEVGSSQDGNTCRLKEKVSAVITREFRSQRLNWSVVPEELDINEVESKTNVPYFFLSVPGLGLKYYIRVHTRNRDGTPIHFPLQLGRIICCRLLGLDESTTDWKDVALSPEEESKRAKDFQTNFKEFDFTLDI